MLGRTGRGGGAARRKTSPRCAPQWLSLRLESPSPLPQDRAAPQLWSCRLHARASCAACTHAPHARLALTLFTVAATHGRWCAACTRAAVATRSSCSRSRRASRRTSRATANRSRRSATRWGWHPYPRSCRGREGSTACCSRRSARSTSRRRSTRLCSRSSTASRCRCFYPSLPSSSCPGASAPCPVGRSSPSLPITTMQESLIIKMAATVVFPSPGGARFERSVLRGIYP